MEATKQDQSFDAWYEANHGGGYAEHRAACREAWFAGAREAIDRIEARLFGAFQA